MANIKHARGLNSTFRYFQDGSEKVLNVKSWSVKQNVTKAADPVCGEARDRLDRVVNSYDVSFECFNTDLAPLAAALDDVENDDTSVAPLDKAAGVKIKTRDGGKSAYIMQGLVLDDFDFGASERSAPVMTTYTARCQYFKRAKAA